MTKLLTFLAISVLAASSLSAGETHTRIESSGKGYVPQPMEREARGGLYVAIFGGVNVAQTADVEDDGGTLGDIETELDSEIGWFGGLKFGYVFPTASFVKPVLEVEGFYNGVEAKFDTESEFGNFDVTADFRSAVFMVNAIVKFECGRFQPYLGAGLGYAHTWIDGVEIEDIEVDDAEEEEGTVAYQGIAGMEFQVSERLGLFTEYKALVLHEVGGLKQYINHLIGVGVRVGF